MAAARKGRNHSLNQGCTACGSGKKLQCRQPKCKCLCHTVDAKK